MTLPPRVRFADSFLGFAFACSGSAAALEAGLRTVQGGVVELMVHPGRSDPRARSSFARDPARESERKVLLSDDFREAVAAAGFAPASFAEMDGGPA